MLRPARVNSFDDCVLYEHTGWFQRLEPYLAILLNVIVIVLLILIIPYEVFLHTPGKWADHGRTLYIIGTTILASAVAAFTADVTRHIWLAVILKDRAAHSKPVSTRTAQRARTLLGLSDFKENLKYMDITLCIVTFGLLVTAIIAGVSPKQVFSEFPYTSRINMSPDVRCFDMAPDTAKPVNFQWQLSNDTDYRFTGRSEVGSVSSRGCAVSKIPAIIDLPMVPDQYTAYTLLGLPVSDNATGTPFDYNLGYGPTFGVQGGAVNYLFDSSSACLPQMVKTPYRCWREGEVSWTHLYFSANSTSCSVTRPVQDPLAGGGLNIGDDNIWDICTKQHQVGTASMIIAGNKAYAIRLAHGMNDDHLSHFKIPPGLIGKKNTTVPTYSLVCSVDVAPTIGFRRVKLERTAGRQQLSGLSGDAVRVVGQDRECVPTRNGQPLNPSDVINEAVLGRGALAGVNMLDDQFWTMLRQYTDAHSPRGPDNFVFPNSRNRVEDLLGVMSAAIVADYWGTLEAPGKEEISLDSGSIVLPVVRIGTGKTWCVIYILPSIYSIVALIYLLAKRSAIRKYEIVQAWAGQIITEP